MSDLVRPWLRRALLEYGQRQTAFERDLEGKYCQITKWLNSRDTDELVWAEVSDSDVIISVQFSPQSARLFEEKWKRRLSKDTRWGVITLLSFRPNFARVPTFNDEEHLNLRVEDFRWEGSEGEACFGNPRDIAGYDEFATWHREWNTGRRDDIQEKLLRFPLPPKYMNKTSVPRNNSHSIGIPGAQPKTKTVGQSSESGRQKSKKSEIGAQAVAKLESQLWDTPLSIPKRRSPLDCQQFDSQCCPRCQPGGFGPGTILGPQSAT
ncbi:hypothetical protein BS47DRAFT_453479 [Hydnum rufescens UP504]|uniref:Shelterin complex subunit TPP1/Est3 domain-containing protein n=1 Tax=Hydnum rufescens UP504 TaxID=1448309 RepID=A0A9P6AI59_9AGAM|nr:hypothetical protein BS47DRAFT_453479 [Hydnum rufescens UP504]